MLLVKSYRVSLKEANFGKAEYLREQIRKLSQASLLIFETIKDCNSYNHNELYHLCRGAFPDLNSKVLQNFLRQRYFRKWKALKSPVKASLLIDPQSFKINFIEEKTLTNYWLRLFRKDFPLRGKNNLEKIKQQLKSVKMVEIFEGKDSNLFCKLVVCRELALPSEVSKTKAQGIDINTKRVVLSDNTFFSLKRWLHRKQEKKKGKQKGKNLENFTKDFFHKLTKEIADHALSSGLEVLVLEDLSGIRKSASKKKSKGKRVNFLVNSCLPNYLFKTLLSYKCLERGIRVVFVNPAFTSTSCPRCNHIDKKNRKGFDFCCTSCNFKSDADLVGSRNILSRFTRREWVTSESNPVVQH